MLISEQKYANKNRLYYRGLADNDKSSKFYKETYLTTRLIYALAYSFGLKGIVEVYNQLKIILGPQSSQLKKYIQSVRENILK